MTTSLTLIAAIIALGLCYVLLPVAVLTYRGMRGRRIVTCPENRQATIIELDAKRAALRSVVGNAKPTVTKCARWPQLHGCDQACVKEAAAVGR